MNKTETKELLFMISAYKPAQQLNIATAPAWHQALTDIPNDDARRAVIELAEEKDFIGVNDIIKRVKHYRAERIDAGFADLTPPDGLSVPDYLNWCRIARRRLGNGETPAAISGVDFRELPVRRLSELPGPKNA